MKGRHVALAGLAAAALGCAHGSLQVDDPSFEPQVTRPAFAAGAGPTVCVDEAHLNFHTVTGRYATFAEVLRRDGFAVRPSQAPFTAESLAACRVLVVANAIARANDKDWKLPAYSAFTRAEIDAVSAWVRAGGSLLLISDHMPFPGSAADLAAAFGVFFHNGFATGASGTTGRLVFKRADASLADHPITRGRAADEQVDSVMTFTGQAFRAGSDVKPLLVFPAGSLLLMPEEAWEFSPRTPRVPADGLLQGAAAAVGNGRLVVFGEAAMFSAQVSGKERKPAGMNVPEAAQNMQLLLNVMRWLAGLLPEGLKN